MIKKYNEFNEGLHNSEQKRELQKLVGKYVQIIIMEDQYGIESGTIGVVDHIDDINNIFVKWENGRSLPMIPEIDLYIVLTEEEAHKYKSAKKFNL